MFAEFPHDPRCLDDGDDMMLGASLLVAPVVEPGQTTRDVYLPAGARWVDVLERRGVRRRPDGDACPRRSSNR